MTLYRGKYRVETARLKEWDYGSPGYYFVTICTRDRLPFFGTVEGETVILSPMGDSAEDCWRAIPDHFGHVTLDTYIIMPNHMHGLVVITQSVETRHVASLPSPSDVSPTAVETPHVASLPPPSDEATLSIGHGNRFGPLKPGSLPVIVQSYKAAVTRWCRVNGYADFAWQARYYDHIIRNEDSLRRIRQYIIDNPTRWFIDRDHPDSVWF